MRFKVRGIYDIEFFLYLKRIGVKNFAFDLRPTSFNFTPMYKIIEMLKATNGDNDTYSFIFDGEKDFVIEQLISSAKKEGLLNSGNCFLELGELKELSNCSKFGLPIIWRFNETMDYRKIPNEPNLHGVSFTYKYFEKLQESNQLYTFLKEILDLKRDDQFIDLRLDWSDHLSESVLDFLPANTYGFEINQQVEKSYRHIDMNLVSSHLEHAKRIINLES